MNCDGNSNSCGNPTSVQGIEHAREYRKNYRRRLAQQIEDLGQPKENSLEWHHQQHLKAQLASRDDGPLEEFDE